MDSRKTYKARRAAGLCAQCGAPSSGRAVCARCTARIIEASRRRRVAREAEGLCNVCGGTKEDPDRKLCRACRRQSGRAHSEWSGRLGAERRRHYRLRQRYGLSLSEWQALFASQGGRCAICGTDDPGCRSGWHTDHCHRTGTVRGILCNGCNVGLGGFKDNVIALQRAARYLVIRGADAQRQAEIAIEADHAG
jgi:hypothetical protein